MNKGPVVRWMWLFFLLISPLWWTPAFSAEGPQTFTLDGRIKQAGTATPILDPSVKIEVHVMDPSRQCVIYAEEQFVNTQVSNGYFNIQVGSNIGAGKRIAGVDPGLSMGTVFSNAAAMTATNVSGQTCPALTYTPTTKDARYFRIFVTPSGTAITDTLADVVLDAVPNAIVAESALSAQAVGGVTAANLLQVNTAGGHVLTQANLDVVFTTSNYSALTALLAGTSTLYNKPAANGTTVIPAIAAPSSPSAGQVWYNAGDILYHDGTTTRTISTGSSTSVSASNGTAASPSISFSGDTDTGWYLAGADNLAAATGGVERVRINENGNLGIGSAAPDARLTLGGNMTAPAWTSSGIGIRQNSATYTDSSSSGTVGFNYVNAFGIPTLAASSATTYTNASAFSLYPPVPGANTTITNSTGLTVNASNLTGVASGYGLQVNAPTGATNNYAASFMGGNVGIGTTAPGFPLEASSPVTGSPVVARLNNSNSSTTGLGSTLEFSASGVSQTRLRTYNENGSGTNTAFTIETRGSSILTERMRINSTGNVGIGTTDPTAALHLKAGTAAAGTAPLKLTAGVNLTAPEAGAIEFDGTSLFYTDSGNVRRTLGVAGSGITALTGEVTASGTGSVAATISNDAVTFAKMQNIATQTLIGRSTAAAGDPESLTVGTGLTITGGALNLTDTTDDDSFATLLGVCANGYSPYKAGGVWTCIEATDLLVNDSLVKRGATGNFAANVATFNGVKLNNAGSEVLITNPIGAAYNLTLPVDDGTPSQVLQTDGAGVLSWTTITPGTGDFKADGSVDMTGTFKAVAGTEALPGITFVGDTNNGIYAPAADNVAITTNGAEKVRIDTTGNVGIGTTAPLDVLHVIGNTRATRFISGSGNAGAPGVSFASDGDTGVWLAGNDLLSFSTGALERVRIDSAGNVGIGTTDPYSNHQLNSSFRVLGLVGSGADDAFSAGYLMLSNNRATVTTGDTTGGIGFGSKNNAGTFTKSSASISSNLAGSGGANGFGGQLKFSTKSDNMTGPTVRMTIDERGRVAVGSFLPTSVMHLKAGTAAAGTAPLKLTSGPVNTTPEAGAIEFDGTSLFYTTDAGVRNTLGVSGSGITALTGEVTASGTGSVAATIANDAVTTVKIANDNVTFAKLQNIATQKLIGRSTAASGDAEELGVGTGLTITGGNLNLTDTTDDDSFATLLGVCADGFVPYRAGGVWTCLEAAAANTNSTLVMREADGDIVATVATLNGVKLNNAGSIVTIANPIGANYSLTLPVDDGTPSQVLQTDGAGVLSWTTITPGTGDFKADGSVDMTGTLKAIPGTAAAPGLTFVGDTDTGIYRAAADQIGFATNGALGLKILGGASNAYISAGTAYFASGNAGSPAYGFENDINTGIFNPADNILAFSSNGAEKMRIHSDGNVGIGTTAPTDKFTVRNELGNKDAIRIEKNAATDRATVTMVPNGALGPANVSYSLGMQASTNKFSLNTWDGTTWGEPVSILSGGNVGIGATAPDTKLQVAGTLRVGDGGETCSGGNFTGGIRYNGGNLQFCNGTAWSSLGVAGSGITALTGEVTASGTGSVAATIANDAVTTVKIADDNVTFAKLQNIATQKLIGRSTAAAGDAEELGVGTGLTITGGNLNLTDTTDDDSFATLLGVCADGFVPYRAGGVWTCLEAAAANTNSTLVMREADGDIVATVATLNGVKLNNAGSIVTIANPIGANYSLTLPVDDGTPSQVLQTDGAGVLSWTTITPGTGDFKADGSVDMTGTFKAVAGTAALPGITFTGDTNNGIYAPAADNVAITTAGVERMRILADGKVGIGTTAPTRLLQVHNTTNNSPVVISRAVNSSDTASLTYIPAGAASGANPWWLSGLNPNEAKYMISSYDGTTVTPRVTVDTAGSVGVGTTAPAYKLDVADGNIGLQVGADYNATTRTNSTTKAARIVAPHYNTAAIPVTLLADYSTATTNELYIGGGTSQGNANTQITFYTAVNNTTATGTERMRIDSSGNVGVGTTAPASKLDVLGSVKIGNGGEVCAVLGAGGLRYNGGAVEFCNGAAWIALGTGSGTGDFKADGSVPMTGTLEGKNGTAASPSFAFDSEPTSGMYRHGASDIGFALGGSTALRILGGASSAYFSTGRLRLENGSAAQPAYGFQNDPNTGLFTTVADTIQFSNNGSETMRISSTGSVGIGTTAPVGPLHVHNPSASISEMYFSNTTSGSTINDGFAIGSSGTDSWVWNNENAPLYFATNDTERMRILANGKVGIGTTAPTSALEVVVNSNTSEEIKIKNTNAGTTAFSAVAAANDSDLATYIISNSSASTGTGVWVPNGGALGVDGAGGLSLLSDHASGSIRMYTAGSAPSNERFRITSAGDVGIGTTAPTRKLHVWDTSSTAAVEMANTTTTTGDDEAFYAGTYLTPTGNHAAGAKRSAGRFYTWVDPANTYNLVDIIGLDGAAYNFSTSGTTDRLFGVSGYAFKDGAGTTSEIIGVSASSESDSGTVTDLKGLQSWSGVYGGTVTNHRGINITMANSGGTITNRYGLYISSPSGAATNDYAIYSNGGQATYLGGNLQVAGVITPNTDNNRTLGSASRRFTTVYATNATINTSDVRQKKDILLSDLGLDFINTLNPVSYRWKMGDDKTVHYGLIAQDTDKAIRDAKIKAGATDTDDVSIVDYDKETDRYGIRYTELISPLIKAVQELYARILGLDKKVEENSRAITSVQQDADAKMKKLEQENAAIKAYICAKDPKAPFCK